MTANVAKQHKMELPPMVKGLKLLDDAGISDQDRNLVLSDINFNNEEEIYKQTKAGLAKYVRMDSEKSSSSSGIKLDSVFTASDKEVLIVKGWSKNGNRGYKSAKGGKEKYKKPQNPDGEDGKVLVCPSCGSYRHLLADCPYSYENQGKKKSQALAAAIQESSEEEDNTFFTADFKNGVKSLAKDWEAEDIVMYSSNKIKYVLWAAKVSVVHCLTVVVPAM